MVALNEGMLVFSNAAATNSIVAAGGRLGSAGLNGTNTVAGSITVTAASLNIHSQAGTGTSSALLITGDINATNKNVEFSEDAGGNPGQIWLLNKPVKLGSGELQGAGARVAVAGNTLGTIHPYNGTLTLETNGAFVGAPALYLGNPGRGRFDLNGHNLIISSLTNTLAADEVTSVLPATLMIANTGDHFYSGLLSGAGLALTKTSAGRVTLSGSNTYGGLTTILWGTLALAGSAGSSSGLPNTPSINVASGSVLEVSGLTNGFSLEAGQLLRGNGSVNGSLTVQAGGTVAPTDPATTTLGSLPASAITWPCCQ